MKKLFQNSFLFQNMDLLGYLAGGSLLAAVIVMVISRNKQGLFGLLFLLLAYGVVTGYLVYQGRIPDRIAVMAYAILFSISAMYLIDMIGQWSERSLVYHSVGRMAVTGLVTLAFAGTVLGNINPCRQKMLELQNLYCIFGDRERGIYQYFADHEDNFYLTTSFMWGTGGYVITEPEGIAHNYAFINGYMIMIPEWQQKLEANGIDVDHILDSFAENENILLILNGDSLTELIQKYLDEKYPGYQIVQEDEIIGFPVYNVQKSE
jgi:hypothetical protein